MKTNKLFAARDLRNSIEKRQHIPSCCGVYQWWCEEDILIKILSSLDLDVNDCKKDIEKTKENIKEKELYCIYVGDTCNLKRRICSNHIKGKIRNSTLRKTIAAVLVENKDEEKVNDIIDKLYVNWYEIKEGKNKKETYHKLQDEKINSCFRPFNNKDITKAEIYTENRHYIKKHKYYYSCMLINKRNSLNGND